MKAREFHNALRILRSIDRDELVEAGAMDDDDIRGWLEFLGNSCAWAILRTDKQFEALWSIIEARMK